MPESWIVTLPEILNTQFHTSFSGWVQLNTPMRTLFSQLSTLDTSRSSNRADRGEETAAAVAWVLVRHHMLLPPPPLAEGTDFEPDVGGSCVIPCSTAQLKRHWSAAVQRRHCSGPHGLCMDGECQAREFECNTAPFSLSHEYAQWFRTLRSVRGQGA